MKKLLFIPLIFISINCFADKITTMQSDGSDSSMVGLWHLNEGTGATTYDNSGNSNNGTIVSGLWIDGLWGKALDFSGSGYVNCGNDSSLSITGSYTWTFNINFNAIPSSGQFVNILGKTISNTGYKLQLFNNSGNILLESVNRGPGGTSVPGTSWNDVVVNKWYRVSVVHDTNLNTDSMYIDNINRTVIYRAGSFLDPMNSNSENLFLANDKIGGNTLNGKIEEFIIYNRVLKLSEITYINSRQIGINQ